MSTTKTPAFVALLLLLVICAPAATGQTGATEGRVVILFTHDLHSYFLPERLPASTSGPATKGGYARLATVIRENRDAHRCGTVLVDAGDFSMGTLFHTAFMSEALELRLMAQMGYDVITLGNHDFDFHCDGLARSLNEARKWDPEHPEMVASNVVFSKDGIGDRSLRDAFRSYPVKEYTVLERNGLRIGVFGIVGKDAQSDTPFAAPVTFANPEESSKRIVETLRNKEKVDIVLCLSHGGTSPKKSHSEDEILARRVPGIDVIISGHTHTVLPKPILIGKTIICAAGSYGANLGVLEISHSKEQGTRLVSYSLSKVTEKTQKDALLAAEIPTFKAIVDREYLSRYGTSFDQIIADSSFDMESLQEAYAHPGETGIGDMITDAYRYAIEKAEGSRGDRVDVVVEPLGHIRSSLLKGNITTSDVFRVLSLGLGQDGTPGYPLVTAYLTGAELKKLLEVETTVAGLKPDAHLQLSGAKCVYNPYRVPFDRVMSLEVQEKDGSYKPVVPTRLYRIGMNYYTALMTEYITRVSHGLISITPKDKQGRRITDLKGTIVPAGALDPRAREIKEWAALVAYMKSLPDTNGNGLPNVPDRYRKPRGRLIADPSLNPVKIFSGATAITYVACAALCAALLILILVLRLVVRIVTRLKRTRRASPRANMGSAS